MIQSTLLKFEEYLVTLWKDSANRIFPTDSQEDQGANADLYPELSGCWIFVSPH